MVILGLGTNLGDRRWQLKRAVTALRRILSDMQCSPVYESGALLPAGAPPEWDIPFFNMAVRGDTELAPHALLGEIKAMERAQGRTDRGHWGPREIDIDILAYDDMIVTDADLHIPHRELLHRDFALIPFADISPLWMYPVAGKHHGKTARALAAGMSSALIKTDETIV